MTLTDLESHINNLKQELQAKSSDGKRLTERIDYLEQDLQQVLKKKKKKNKFDIFYFKIFFSLAYFT